jgi:hypothetical protein
MPKVTDKLCHIMYRVHPAWVGVEHTTLVVIGTFTDCKGSCKSNYHKITTTTAPWLIKGHPIVKIQMYIYII